MFQTLFTCLDDNRLEKNACGRSQRRQNPKQYELQSLFTLLEDTLSKKGDCGQSQTAARN